MNTRIFTIILQMNKNELNAYDLRHLTVNLRGGELKLRFNQQSSPMEVIVQQLDSNKVRQQTVHIIKVPPPPNFLCKEILFKLLTFRYAITRKSEESSPRKSLPVLHTPSAGPSRLRILSPLICKERHWFAHGTRPPLMTSRTVYALYQEFIPVTKTNLDTLLYL